MSLTAAARAYSMMPYNAVSSAYQARSHRTCVHLIGHALERPEWTPVFTQRSRQSEATRSYGAVVAFSIWHAWDRVRFSHGRGCHAVCGPSVAGSAALGPSARRRHGGQLVKPERHCSQGAVETKTKGCIRPADG